MSSVTVLSCPQCGATINADRHTKETETKQLMACDYCGSTLTLQTPNQPSSTQASTQSGNRSHKYGWEVRPCLRCHHKLHPVRIDGHAVHACERCAGVWVPNRVIDGLHPSSHNPETLQQLNIVSRKQQKQLRLNFSKRVRCPDCGLRLLKKRYPKKPKVAIDYCAEHGIWFDGNEIMGIQRHKERQCHHRKNMPKDRRKRRYLFRRGWPLFALIWVVLELLEEIFD